MKYLVKVMAQNHVAANVLLLLVFLGGWLSSKIIQQEVFPSVELPFVSVSVSYPGAAPTEVEQSLCMPLEKTIASVDGVRDITCSASEGGASITVEMEEGVVAREASFDIQAAVDALTLPEDASRPTVREIIRFREIMRYALHGNIPEESLLTVGKSIRDTMQTLPQVRAITISGERESQINVAVNPQALRTFGITLDQVVAALRVAKDDLPIGRITTKGGNILLRQLARRSTVDDIASMPIKAVPGGGVIRLSQIATVEEELEDSKRFSLMNNNPAIVLEVQQSEEYSPIEVSEEIRKIVAEQITPTLPKGVELKLLRDASEDFKGRFDMLIRNAWIGLILVLVSLGLFLEIRLAFWVMLGIPISFLGSLVILPLTSVTINMNSLFAFILVLGIVVDDAIVIGENIYRHREMGKPPLQASIDGTLEVAPAVTFAILTTVAAFAPLLWVEGVMGSFLYAIPLIVSAVLLVSLVEGLFILPSHIASTGTRPWTIPPFSWIEKARKRSDGGLTSFREGSFLRMLSWCLCNRYTTLAIGAASLIIPIGLVAGGIVKSQFFPNIEGDTVSMDVEYPAGYPRDQLMKHITHASDVGQQLLRDIDQKAGNERQSFDYFNVVVSENSGRRSSGKTSVSMRLRLKPEKERNTNTFEFSRAWRRAVGTLPDAESLSTQARGMRFGNDIDITLSHDSVQQLHLARDELKDFLTTFRNVNEVADSEKAGSREIRLLLTDSGRAAGLTPVSMARTLRTAYQGTEAFSVIRGSETLPVIVMFPEEARSDLSKLKRLMITTPFGGEIALADAADFIEGQEPASLTRINGRRVLSVTGKFNEQARDQDDISKEVKNEFLPKLLANHPGLRVETRGMEKEREKTTNSIYSNFGIAMAAIYALLAMFFKSYTQPILIMLAIPFGLAGAILGHLVLGFPVSAMSFFGFVGLSGVVVNDALILIDAVNRYRNEGLPLQEAVIEATKTRLRPILLTSVTTFCGVMPMLLENSRQAQHLVPMAVSLGVGIVFSTVITLLLVPTFYLILEDVKRLFRWEVRNV